MILFGASNAGLLRVSDSGGPAAPVTRIDASRQEMQHAGPVLLPDGRRFLYHRASRAAGEHRHLHRLDRGDPGESEHHAAAGHRLGSGVCARVGRIRRRFHPVPAAGRAAGPGVRWMRRCAEIRFPYPRTSATLGSYGWFSASPSGAIAFRAGATGGGKADLVWFDRKGQRLGQLGPSLDLGTNVQLSPDGKRVAVNRGALTELSGAFGNIQGARIWTAELSRGGFQPFDHQAEGIEDAPAISPDGHVAFTRR